MCLCGLNLLSSLQNKSDLVTHIPEEDPALGQSLFDVHGIWIKVLKVVIKGTNLLFAQPKNFFLRNPSGTFRDIHW